MAKYVRSWSWVLAAGLIGGVGALVTAPSSHSQSRAPVSAHSHSPSKPLLLFSQLEKGQWTLTERGHPAPWRTICFGRMSEMLRPVHRSGDCNQFVIENKPNRATIHYSCTGTGHGHTIIRRETSRLVQIETQGIVNGRPFDHSIEARRTGSCGRS